MLTSAKARRQAYLLSLHISSKDLLLPDSDELLSTVLNATTEVLVVFMLGKQVAPQTLALYPLSRESETESTWVRSLGGRKFTRQTRHSPTPRTSEVLGNSTTVIPNLESMRSLQSESRAFLRCPSLGGARRYCRADAKVRLPSDWDHEFTLISLRVLHPVRSTNARQEAPSVVIISLGFPA